jgi:hypothetical protein
MRRLQNVDSGLPRLIVGRDSLDHKPTRTRALTAIAQGSTRSRAYPNQPGFRCGPGVTTGGTAKLPTGRISASAFEHEADQAKQCQQTKCQVGSESHSIRRGLD